ncbi:MAG: hypothetical protein SVR81_05625 [Chloroflexota bacterium]|nr:hypothetical protein [Chloroflexota bacterium]
MKLVINEKLIKRNKKIGNVMSIAGIAILIGGLVVSFNPTPTKTIISFAALIIGFIVSQASTFFINRFGREPRFDEVIADNLNKLNNDYTLYVYSSPVPLLLVGPQGLWMPVPVSARGEIYYDKKWKQHGGSFLLKLFGQENIGRPEVDVESNEKALNAFFEKYLPELDVPTTNSVLVSMNPDAGIGDVDEAPLPIVDASALRRYIRKIDRKVEVDIAPEVLGKINDAFQGSE